MHQRQIGQCIFILLLIILVQLAAIDQLGVRQIAQIVRRIETWRLIQRHAAFFQHIGDELRTDKFLMQLTAYLELDADESDDAVGIPFPVGGKMLDETLEMVVLLRGQGDFVNLAGDIRKFSERTLADDLGIEGCGEGDGLIVAAEAVKLMQRRIGGKGDMGIGHTGDDAYDLCNAGSCSGNDHIDGSFFMRYCCHSLRSSLVSPAGKGISGTNLKKGVANFSKICYNRICRFRCACSSAG